MSPTSHFRHLLNPRQGKGRVIDRKHFTVLSSITTYLVFSVAVLLPGSAGAQTAADIQLNQALMNLLPQPVIDPTTDPPLHFTNVIPKQFDPGKTNLVQASWLSGTGCPTNAFTATPNADFTAVQGTLPFTDTACPTGDPNDQRNQGLLLVKTGPTSNFASATAELINIKGITLTELGYDIRKFGPDPMTPLGSHCGAGAPPF